MFLDELKNALENKKAVIGSKRTVKYLKTSNIRLIVVSHNCPDSLRNDLEHYAKLSGIKVEKYDGTSKQLGIFCGKPFPVASVGIEK